MTPTPVETVLLAAGIAAGAMAIVIIAYVVLSRRSDAKLARLRADYEASVAPFYAALIRSGNAKLAGQSSSANETTGPTSTESTP